MKMLKNIFQITLIIVLFLGTTATIKAQELATDEINLINEFVPTVIGINYEDISANIEVYEKDNTYYLEMKGQLNGVFEATVFNVDGKELKVFEVTKTTKKQKFEIATQNLDKGIYIVEVRQGQRKAYKRLFKTESNTTF